MKEFKESGVKDQECKGWKEYWCLHTPPMYTEKKLREEPLQVQVNANLEKHPNLDTLYGIAPLFPSAHAAPGKQV